MDALISGQAGIAVLVQGNDVTVVTAESESRGIRYSPDAVPYLLAGATDVIELKAASRNDVLGQLRLQGQLDRALQCMLILLDKGETIENRKLAVECLSDYFGNGQVLEHVANRLYSAPLPRVGDAETAVSLAQGFRSLERFLRELGTQQAQIESVRRMWDDLPVSLFETETAKQEFREVAITRGAFRLLASIGSDPTEFGLVAIQCHQNLSALPNYRKILNVWLAPFKQMLASPSVRPVHGVRETGTERPDYRRSHVRPRTHELFENVTRQKEAIVELIKKGDIAHARMYAYQLLNSQLNIGDPEYAAMSLCDLAQEAKAVHNYSFQVELALKAIEIAPEDGWAHGQVADAYLCLGQYDNALKSFDLVATFGQSSFAVCGRARLQRALGKLDESLASFEQAIKLFPEDYIAWCGRAEVLRDMWRLDEALGAYDATVQKFPNERVPFCGRAAVLKDMGRLTESLEAYDQVIRDLGGDHVPICGRADILKNLGRMDQALAAYRSAIEAFPLECIPRCGEADVLKEMGKVSEAIDAYSQAAEAFPYEPVPLSGRAESLERAGKLQEAFEAYEEALRKFPNDAWLRNGRADALKRLGRLKEALKTYDENIARSPYDLIAWSGRADILKELGELKEAAAAYDKLMMRYPGKQAIRNSKAAVLAALRRYEDALALLPEGEAQTREEWIAQHIRGMIHLRRGNNDLAIRLFENGIAKIPFAHERRYFEIALAVARLRMKKFDQAVDFLGKGSEPLTNVLRMHALAGLKRLDQAQDVLRGLETTCPQNLRKLKDELAARYSLSRRQPKHDARWIFDEECRSALLEAA